jgi:hypothetical protein
MRLLKSTLNLTKSLAHQSLLKINSVMTTTNKENEEEMKSALKNFYERTVLFNQLAGKNPPTNPDSIEFTRAMLKQIERVQEELNELKDAINVNDKEGIIDGVVDINVCSLYMGEMLFEAGYKIDGACLEVARNNLTKITEDYSIACKSAEQYGESYCYIDTVKFNGGYYYSVKRVDDDKILKPINYTSVSLKGYLP